jgi:hypothetical protein
MPSTTPLPMPSSMEDGSCEPCPNGCSPREALGAVDGIHSCDAVHGDLESSTYAWPSWTGIRFLDCAGAKIESVRAGPTHYVYVGTTGKSIINRTAWMCRLQALT